MAGTTSDKLALLRQIKESFRTAITGKGQTISNDEPFSAWPAKVEAIETGVDQTKIKVLKSSKSYPFDVMDSTNKILYLQFDGAIPDKSKILSVSLYMYDASYSPSKTNLIITGLSAYKAPIVPDFLNAHIVNNIVMSPQEYSLPVNYTPATCPSGWTLSNTIAISLSGLGSNVSGYTASAFGNGACSYFLYYYDD